MEFLCAGNVVKTANIWASGCGILHIHAVYNRYGVWVITYFIAVLNSNSTIVEEPRFSMRRSERASTKSKKDNGEQIRTTQTLQHPQTVPDNIALKYVVQGSIRRSVSFIVRCARIHLYTFCHVLRHPTNASAIYRCPTGLLQNSRTIYHLSSGVGATVLGSMNDMA